MGTGEESTGGVVDQSATATHQLVQSVDELLRLVPQLEEADEFQVLASVEEASLARFDLECRIFAKHGRQHELKDYLSKYNRLAAKNGWRTIEYTGYARHMAMVGARFLESDKQMTEHYWALPQTFFIEALVAGDRFFTALDMAHEKVEASIRTKNAPNFTRVDFREALAPPEPPPGKSKKTEQNVPPAAQSGESSEKQAATSPEVQEPLQEAPTELDVVVDRARQELGDAVLREVLERILAGEEAPAIDVDVEPAPPPPEAVEPALGDGGPAEAATSQRACYDCTRCERLKQVERLALVTVGGDDRLDEVLGVLKPLDVWLCRRTRQLISVRGKEFERAAVIAGECEEFESMWVKDGEDDSEAHEAESEEPISVDDLMDDD